MQKIATFLMFEGQGEEAMSFYLSLFPDSKLESIARYGEGETGRAGSVQHATFSLNDQLFMCIDSPVKHQFTFTPSMSLHVTSPLTNHQSPSGLPISRSTRFANDQFQRDNTTPDSNLLTFQQTDRRIRCVLPQFLGLRPNRRKRWVRESGKR
jgi:hypothetical protein